MAKAQLRARVAAKHRDESPPHVQQMPTQTHILNPMMVAEGEISD